LIGNPTTFFVKGFQHSRNVVGRELRTHFPSPKAHRFITVRGGKKPLSKSRIVGPARVSYRDHRHLMTAVI
jgi:hypothetical protein